MIKRWECSQKLLRPVNYSSVLGCHLDGGERFDSSLVMSGSIPDPAMMPAWWNLADTLVLETSAARREGSSPSVGTMVCFVELLIRQAALGSDRPQCA